MDQKNRIVKIGDIQIKLKRDADTCTNCMYGYKTNPKKTHWCRFIRDPRDLSDKNSSFSKFCRYSGLVGPYEIPEDGSLDNFPHDSDIEIPKSSSSIEMAVHEYCKNFCILECTETCPLKPYKQ